MTLNTLIENFSVNTLKDFFREKINTFKLDEENYKYLFDENDYINENYNDIVKIGEADLIKSDDLLVIAVKTIAPLTNRTGKKRQYEIAKKILKEENKDAAFFIFYDGEGNFRFSLIRVNFLGAKRDFTDFKRYTYFVSPKQTNKTFINQISKCDFNSLNSIQDAFSVEPITKQFYEKLQRWYFWAIKNVEFPKDAEQETNGREVAIIRLITRLMFIWFMKVRNLIPANLFDEENISKILKDFSAEESTYYKAILQNLFFATLNTKQNERKFRSEKRGAKGYNPDYGNHNLFRYHNLFRREESLDELFSKIPFLNGGLFECLDYKTKDKKERKYIDGFTATKENQPKVPNSLFFSEIQKVDISSFFGKANKTYEVEGLINLLNSYNFTIDENEPDDVEVALDPELLGSIFENLLASYNPETATTARKATGSFYTPREIVNYMTIESLKQYFKTNIISTSLNNHSELDEKLDSLINAGSSENPFDEETTKQLIKLINNLRVVDPAVGSGAFPMAMLNKLVFILSKLDPDNKHWKQSQIDGVKKSVTDSVIQRKLIEQIERQFNEKNADYGRKLYLIEKCIYGVDIQQIAVEIAKLRFFISLLVDEKIDFDKPENNYGIEPLPNLEFKLMQGNSLISTYAGIDFAENNYDSAINEKTNELKHLKSTHKEIESEFIKIYNKERRQDKNLKSKLTEIVKNIKTIEKEIKELETDRNKDTNEPYKKLIKEFEELKNEYQNEADNQTKKELRNKIDKAIINIFEQKINEHNPQLKNIEEKYSAIRNKEQRQKAITEEKQKLTKKLGFDIEKDLIAYTEGRKEKEFFLWSVYFAEVFSEKGGFDVVIGNPPYVEHKKLKHIAKELKPNYEVYTGSSDLSVYFFERGFSLLKGNGTLSYISTNKFFNTGYGRTLRKYLLTKKINTIINFEQVEVFDGVLVSSVVFISENKTQNKNGQFKFVEFKKENDWKIDFEKKLNERERQYFQNIYDDSEWVFLNSNEASLKKKIEKNGKIIQGIKGIEIKRGVTTGFDPAFIVDNVQKKNLNDDIIKPLLKGRDIKKYKYNLTVQYLIFTRKGIDIEKHQSVKRYLQSFRAELTPKKKTSDVGRKSGIYNWFEIQDNTAYYPLFEKEKIIWPLTGDKWGFTIDENKHYLTSGGFFMVSHKYSIKVILAVLNSKLMEYYFRFIGVMTAGGAYTLKKATIEYLPICFPKNNKPFETLVDKIIEKKELGEVTTAEEREIDIMVYKLYELTYDEVKIVEPTFALTENEYNKMRF